MCVCGGVEAMLGDCPRQSTCRLLNPSCEISTFKLWFPKPWCQSQYTGETSERGYNVSTVPLRWVAMWCVSGVGGVGD